MPNILVFAESRGGTVRGVVMELLSAAREKAAGGEVHAVLAGAPGIGSQAERLAGHGADTVFVTEHAALGEHNAEALADLVADRCRNGGYRAVLFAASAQGRDLGPRVAAKLGVPMAPDALSLSFDGDTTTVTHYVYAGKIIATLKLSATPAVVAIRPGAFAASAAKGAGKVEPAPPVGDPAAARVMVTESIRGDARKLDLADAPVIVSGGRGLKAAENFKLVEELAEAFGNAAVGATRAVTDEGWRPHSDQIGQTGRQVSPDLYVAVGISGAIQHLAGMRTSRTIVAINKDRDAPIFKIADYGVVGDVFEIVPALTAAIREAKAKG
jgi:electron transfer flavoprotein alpha subunit